MPRRPMGRLGVPTWFCLEHGLSRPRLHHTKGACGLQEPKSGSRAEVAGVGVAAMWAR